MMKLQIIERDRIDFMIILLSNEYLRKILEIKQELS